MRALNMHLLEAGWVQTDITDCHDTDTIIRRFFTQSEGPCERPASWVRPGSDERPRCAGHAWVAHCRVAA